ncbi:alpha/beta-hydrolase [Halenospora varia]|nr:alpha/beta-hydrolase [Halenospora varia]
MEFIAALLLLPCQSLSLPYIGIPRLRRIELHDNRDTMGDDSQTEEDRKSLSYIPTPDGRPRKQSYSTSHPSKREPPNITTPTSMEPSQKTEPREGSMPLPDEKSIVQNPLFPPLPSYEPSTTLRIKSLVIRPISFVSTLMCLGLLGFLAACKTIGSIANHAFQRLTFRNPDKKRPFYEEEKKRKIQRAKEEKAWKKKSDTEQDAGQGEFVPTEGGPDPIVCDVSYYARRVGLGVEFFKVQTEDGFIIDLWHVYDPAEYTPLSEVQRAARGPEVWNGSGPSRPHNANGKKPKFPVLLIHGLLQSSGTFCVNDDDSLAFFLCKAGYDVWLGNNRCGFTPEHATLKTTDPRMWSWTPREMGTLDLPALTSRVLSETGFEKLGFIGHSQGTTQTFIALSKDQRPELGEKISVFCALAPAVYAGPLIQRFYFEFMSLLTPRLYHLVFGIHAFIPFMMTMHKILPGHIYGFFGYRMYHYLFDWSDTRWDRGLRDRMFQFAPVYVGAESMKWWLGRECFAKQKCILSTREENLQEDELDKLDLSNIPAGPSTAPKPNMKAARQWYNEQVPPFAIWATGSDELVDGRKLLNRFNRGREPHARIVHQKVIEEYEHLDVVWAMDAIEQVGREVRDVLWMTCPVRDEVRVPRGCEEVDVWRDPKGEKAKEVV